MKVRGQVLVRMALEGVDFRKSIDGLAKAVGAAFGGDPMAVEGGPIRGSSEGRRSCEAAPLFSWSADEGPECVVVPALGGRMFKSR